ncbi:alpha/beta hydrolase [Streptomyces sp. OF3]|uniref:Alpha/beta hydrolase n=1 Tax=Streptomyces alkaliterrae TaxID=2213162 RepID=A0A7W3ZME3_9ACTN|nr:alpha/beta hydrolase [Streptomyces alkaliterrae]MBB1253824.1 alpha/beta hydrolase [Streptomyces alkaliterrae]
MSDQRTHSATTGDGVTIVGTVHGQGRPLVFLQGMIGDGDTDWGPLVGHLAGRFTCYLPSLRGRGLSGDHEDLGPGRLVEDVLTYVGSIGEPTGLVGWSYGAYQALSAAARSDRVEAVACLEPGMMSLMDEREQAVLGAAVGKMAELAADGSLADAARAFAGWPFSDEEIAVADRAGYFEASGRYVPNLLSLLQQSAEYKGPTPEDPAVLGAISVPVAVLHGARTSPFLIASARYVAEHVPDARVRELPDAGHASLLTHPEALAAALSDFFTQAHRTA